MTLAELRESGGPAPPVDPNRLPLPVERRCCKGEQGNGLRRGVRQHLEPQSADTPAVRVKDQGRRRSWLPRRADAVENAPRGDWLSFRGREPCLHPARELL